MSGIDLGALQEVLFRQLDRLDACGTPEEIDVEIRRAKAVERVAEKAIDNANTAIRATELRIRAEDATLGTLAPLPPMLRGGDE